MQKGIQNFIKEWMNSSRKEHYQDRAGYEKYIGEGDGAWYVQRIWFSPKTGKIGIGIGMVSTAGIN